MKRLILILPMLVAVQAYSNELLESKLKKVSVTGSKYEKELASKIIDHFADESINKKNIQEIKETIHEYYQNEEEPFVKVTVPSQDITQGHLKLNVTEARIDSVQVRQNRWFSDAKLQQSLGLDPGDPIHMGDLCRSLYWLNRNPFRNVSVVFAPGKDPGTTNIELISETRFPLRIYSGIDNTGNDVTGNNRLMAGFNWGNAFSTDQQLSFQYTTDDEFKRFMAYTLHYTAPLPWYHLIDIYGGYSYVDGDFTPVPPTTSQGLFKTKGFSVQASFRYDIPMPSTDGFLHEFTWGADWKRTNNDLLFSETPVVGKLSNLTQIMAGYNLGYTSAPLSTTFEIEGFYSPVKWLPDQEISNYQSIRPFSQPQYFYFRSAFTLLWRYYKKWEFRSYLRGQVANQNLLPSEEFGIGGYDTVRGYKERTFNGDYAFVMNYELRTPQFSLLHLIGRKSIDRLQFLAFLDYGWAKQNRAPSYEEKSETLWSIGPGLRYLIGSYVTLRADWGVQMTSSELGGPQQRVHFSFILNN